MRLITRMSPPVCYRSAASTLFVLWIPTADAQAPCNDLVTNGGVENIGACPGSYYPGNDCAAGDYIGSGGFMPSPCAPWIQVTYGSVDVRNTCFDPLALISVDPPHSGDGFAGFYTYSTIPSPGWWEYFGQTFTDPMVAGQTYCISYWARSTEEGWDDASSCVDVLISDTPTVPPSPTYFAQLSGISPTHTWCPSLAPLPGHNSTPWELVSFNYTANGGETWIMFGLLSAMTSWGGAYVHVDDVSIVPLTGASAITTVDDCDGACAGSASAGAAVDWYLGDGTLINSDTASIDGLCAGTYLAVGGCGCGTDTVAFIITDANCGLQLELFGDTVCEGQFTTLSASVSGGAPPYVYSWQPSIFSGPGPFTFPVDSAFVVQLTITDQSSATISATAQIETWPSVMAQFTMEHLTAVDVQFNSLSVGATGWYWSFGDGGSSQMEDPMHTYISVGDFPVSLLVNNAFGCTDTAHTLVSVQVEPTLYVPNAFTPNGDGFNDHFEVVTLYMSDVQLDIFDRWGEELFSTSGSPPTWDGTYAGAPVMDGVYVWKVRARGMDRSRIQRIGSVTVLR